MRLITYLTEFARDTVRTGVDGFTFRLLMLVLSAFGAFVGSIVFDASGLQEPFEDASLTTTLAGVLPFLYRDPDAGGGTNVLALCMLLLLGLAALGFLYQIDDTTPAGELAEYVLVSKATYASTFGVTGGASVLAGLVGGGGETVGIALGAAGSGLYFIPMLTLCAPPVMFLFYVAYGTLCSVAFIGVSFGISICALRGAAVFVLWLLSYFFTSIGHYDETLWIAPWESWTGIFEVRGLDVLIFFCYGPAAYWGVQIIYYVCYGGGLNHVALGRGLALWIQSWLPHNKALRAVYRLRPSEAHEIAVQRAQELV